jgi:hypothetical protein
MRESLSKSKSSWLAAVHQTKFLKVLWATTVLTHHPIWVPTAYKVKEHQFLKPHGRAQALKNT